MTAQMELAVTFQPENAARFPGALQSLDLDVLNAIFKLIEVAEPTLLLCRDALAVSGDHAPELKAIQSTLNRIGELKANGFRSPADPFPVQKSGDPQPPPSPISSSCGSTP